GGGDADGPGLRVDLDDHRAAVVGVDARFPVVPELGVPRHRVRDLAAEPVLGPVDLSRLLLRLLAVRWLTLRRCDERRTDVDDTVFAHAQLPFPARRGWRKYVGFAVLKASQYCRFRFTLGGSTAGSPGLAGVGRRCGIQVAGDLDAAGRPQPRIRTGIELDLHGPGDHLLPRDTTPPRFRGVGFTKPVQHLVDVGGGERAAGL